MPTGPKGEKRPSTAIGNPLAGISDREQEIMLRLLRTPRQQQKRRRNP